MKCFPFICYHILPLVYSPGLSDYEVLCKCIEYINKLAESDKDLAEHIAVLDGETDDLKARTAAIEQELQNISDGKYIEKYLSQMLETVRIWVNENLAGIVGNAMRFVSFGLSPSGHFIAMIPDNWNLKFGTIMDVTSELYGHLYINY